MAKRELSGSSILERATCNHIAALGSVSGDATSGLLPDVQVIAITAAVQDCPKVVQLVVAHDVANLETGHQIHPIAVPTLVSPRPPPPVARHSARPTASTASSCAVPRASKVERPLAVTLR